MTDLQARRCARCNGDAMLGDCFCVDCRHEQNQDDARFADTEPAAHRVQILLSAVDNALRNGSYMTGANLAFNYLCDQLDVDREQLPLFDPQWSQTLPDLTPIQPGAGAGGTVREGR